MLSSGNRLILAGTLLGVLTVAFCVYQFIIAQAPSSSIAAPAKMPTPENHDFDRLYKLPEYGKRAEQAPGYYQTEVSSTEFKIPSSSSLLREDILNAAAYQIYRYYLAQYAWKKKILWQPGMAGFIDNMAALLIYPYATDPGSLLKFTGKYPEGQLLVDAGIALAQSCRDNHGKSRDLNRKMQEIATKLSRDPDFPPLALLYFCSGIAQYNHRWDIDFSDDGISRMTAAALASAFASGNIRDSDLQTIFRMMQNSEIKMLFSNLLKRFSPPKTIPQYYVKLLEGTAMVEQAWEDMPRSGYYNETKNRTFLDKMAHAGTLLKESYRLRPDLPEAAGAMITVETGIYKRMVEYPRSGQDERIEWFNRCVRAQSDYMRAYEDMAWSLFARRNGFHNLHLPDDHDLATAFRKAILKCNLYNSDVPLFYIRPLELEAMCRASQDWRRAFSDKETIDNMSYIFNYCQDASDNKNRQIKRLAYKVVFDTYSGKYADAIAVKQELPAYVKENNMSWYNSRRIVERPNWRMIENETTMAGGAEVKELEQLNELFNQERYDDAAVAICGMMEKKREKPEKIDFLMKRLAECHSTCGFSWEWFHSDPLWVAIRLGNAKGSELLLNAGCKPHNQERTGKPMLYSYIECGSSSKITELLIKAGCDPDAVNRGDHNRTPLQLAISYNRKDVIPVLIRHSRDINRRGDNSLSALDSAIHKCPIKTMEEIIAKGANVNQCDNDGWSPLYRAVYINRQDIVAMLLKHGADINIRDRSGKTALDIARNQEMAGYLRANGAKHGREL